MKKFYTLTFILLFLTGCATYKTKYAADAKAFDVPNKKEVAHTFYLIGDAGLSPVGGMNPVLRSFEKRLNKATSNSTVVFLGDNIYPKGLPAKDAPEGGYATAKSHLDAQLNTVQDFAGNIMFIPGNHDWYNDGVKGVERQQKYIEKALDSKNVFFPEDGCPLQKVDINDKTVVIAIDTQWFMANWDKNPTINDECEIKDREKFFEELEGLIKKNATKTTIIAMHHPMFTYGPHGGQFSFKQQFFPSSHSIIPLPVLGSVINVLRRTTGASTADIQNKRYQELKKRIVTLAQYSEKVIFASGHEHTLQYIVEENTPQIVSGSGAKKGVSRRINGSKFSTGKRGYATLEVYTDGASRVRFFEVDDAGKESFLFTDTVLGPDKKPGNYTYDTDFPATVKAAIYSQEEITKTGFFKGVWGERYRKYYGVEVAAPTVNLDTLFGGLTPMRKGGGHQSKSLRLKDKEGREYVMRALRKSAELYLQAIAFKDQYIIGDFENTFTEKILLDFYTGSHPYAPLAVGTLADAAGIYHTNPQLFYVPKQNALSDFNSSFGNELYLIEERTDSGHGNLKSFGYSNKLISTDDLIKQLRKDEKYRVDTEAYAKARLFDILIGDWDRHVDQWRWAEFKNESGEIVYRPIPRDRDQVFSILGDGALMGFATRAVPGLALFEGFNEEIRSVKGFTSSPLTYALDLALLTEVDQATWQEQAAFLQEKITPEIIDQALAAFPAEVQDETVTKIKKVLLARKKNLIGTATAYHKVINKFAVVSGTDKDDYFTIKTLPNGKTQVTGNRIKAKQMGEVFFDRTFDRAQTKEIWIYGLDDDDVFEVHGKNNGMTIRLVGGQNNDTYKVKENSRAHIYDFKSKKNTYDEVAKGRIHRKDDYDTNTYQFIKIKNSNNQILPQIGANPDDGLLLGFTDIYTFNGFKQNPFTSQHTFNAAFYFATNGFDLSYKGEFAEVIGKGNLELNAKFTSPNFSINFFGFGNETPNFDDDLDLDFNRVKIRNVSFAPSLVWRGKFGSKFRTGISYEAIEVEATEDRFISTFLPNGEDENKNFLGADAAYSFSNADNEAYPTLGMKAALHFGYKANTDDIAKGFGFVIPSLSFDYRLSSDGRLVLATKLKGHVNIGNNFEFYQAASIGGNNGLRGYRFQRFTGRSAFYQNTDLRYSLLKRNTGLLPVTLGLYGGFDYGRVWFPGDDSNIWNTSGGGGFFVNASDLISAQFALFSSDDGLRFAFGLGFGF